MEKYPKVYALGHKYIQDILDDKVLVEEKIDGCFRGDTLIRLANGKTETISKIVNNKSDIEVLSYNKTTKIIEPKKVINWFKFQNNEPFYKIKIKGQGQHRNWNNLYATNNHNIFTNTGKKQVKDLKTGDIIFRPQYRLDYIQEQMVLGSLLGDSGITTIQHEQPLVESEILSIEIDPIIKLSKYDIEVADNHNYFAENILVSNSQINFFKSFDNSLSIFSRTTKLNLETPDKMFQTGVDYILSIQDKLIPGYNYHGEYLNRPKHNTLSYGRVPKNNIIIFDIETDSGIPLQYANKKIKAEKIGLETVPMLYYGKVLNVGELFDLLETPSILGNEKIEGVVVKNYNKYTPFNFYYVGKYVSERFKEKHDKDWKIRNPSNKSIVEQLIADLKTEARWYKAVQHLKESGKFLGEPKDIGELFKLVTMDIDEEEQDYIKDVLYKHFVKDIKRHITYGLPEWYKIKLAEGGI